MGTAAPASEGDTATRGMPLFVGAPTGVGPLAAPPPGVLSVGPAVLGVGAPVVTGTPVGLAPPSPSGVPVAGTSG